MNKAYFINLAAYNQWADEKVISWISAISEEQWKMANVSSFSSVKQTAIHIVSAEKIWYDFWNCMKDPVFLSGTFDGTKDDLLSVWNKSSANICRFISEHAETEFDHPVNFSYPDGRIGQLKYFETFGHCINHATYHRGQIVTLLRQAGFKDLSSIDLSTYYILNQALTA